MKHFTLSPSLAFSRLWRPVACLTLALAPVGGTAYAQQVYRCPGNLYTDALSPKEAAAKGCKTLDGAPITVIQSMTPRASSTSNRNTGTSAASSSPENKVASEEQKAHYLPRIIDGTDFWCQGYSEPGAGSDLASLKTKAERVGDHYIINGQKTWTTLAQHADWGFFLCRTDPTAKAQEGISFILVDMKTPGVEVKPIKLLDGGYEVNETWLTDVRVPVENLVGVENKGWTYAKFLLAHERSGIAGVARSKRGVEKLREIAANETLDGAPLIKDFDFAKKVSQLEIDLAALEITELRTLAGEQAGKGPGPESSILKIKGTEIQQRLTELTLEAVGTYSAPYYGSIANDTGSNEYAVGPAHAQHAAATYFNMRKTSIYGGSNEIQRNIITKMILGL